MNIPNLLTDAQLHDLKESSANLKKLSDECVNYRNSLSKLWRVLKDTYDKTDAQIRACEALRGKIEGIIGEKAP